MIAVREGVKPLEEGRGRDARVATAETERPNWTAPDQVGKVLFALKVTFNAMTSWDHLNYLFTPNRSKVSNDL